MRFTDANVKAYKDDRPSYALWDQNLRSFGFRVQAGGSKVYYAKYRIGTKQRMYRIGRVDKLSLADATKKAKAIFNSVADSVDPFDEREKATAKGAHTFAPAYEIYLAKMKTDGRAKSYIDATKS